MKLPAWLKPTLEAGAGAVMLGAAGTHLADGISAFLAAAGTLLLAAGSAGVLTPAEETDIEQVVEEVLDRVTAKGTPP